MMRPHMAQRAYRGVAGNASGSAIGRTDDPGSCNVREKEEVAALYETALAPGVREIRDPHDIFWGGHIDNVIGPDGYVREFAWNPSNAKTP